MVKKIVILVLLMVLFTMSCSVCYANDAGLMKDNGKNLILDVTPMNTEIEIGGELKLSITATNTTPELIGLWMIDKIFASDYEWIYSLQEFDMPQVPAYETVQFDITCIVPPNIDWYEYHDKFYVDIDLRLEYFTIVNDWYYEESEANRKDMDFTWEHTNLAFKSETLQITNLYNGDELAEVKVTADSELNYCYEYIGPNFSGYTPYYTSQVDIKNIGEEPIEIVAVNGKDCREDGVQLQHNEIAQYYSSPYLPSYDDVDIDKMPAVMTLHNKVMFLIDDKYYGVYQNKRPEVVKYKYRDLRVWIISNEENKEKDKVEGEYIVRLKNATDRDMHNVMFLFDSDYSDRGVYASEIKAGNVVEYPIKINGKDTLFSYKCGWEIGSKIILWEDISGELVNYKYYGSEYDRNATVNMYHEYTADYINQQIIQSNYDSINNESKWIEPSQPAPEIKIRANIYADSLLSEVTVYNDTNEVINNLVINLTNSPLDSPFGYNTLIRKMEPNSSITYWCRVDVSEYLEVIIKHGYIDDENNFYLWRRSADIVVGNMITEYFEERLGPSNSSATYYRHVNDLYEDKSFSTPAFNKDDVYIPEETEKPDSSITYVFSPNDDSTSKPENKIEVEIDNTKTPDTFPKWTWIVIALGTVWIAILIHNLRKEQ